MLFSNPSGSPLARSHINAQIEKLDKTGDALACSTYTRQARIIVDKYQVLYYNLSNLTVRGIMAGENTAKRTVNRSAAYPGVTLEQAIDAAKTLRSNLGNGPYSRESAAKALGYSGVTGTSSTKIAGCVHFGLLNRVGNTYKQSDLATAIFNPRSEQEKSGAIKESFRNPVLYEKLSAEYDGKALPIMLDNVLVRLYGIQERAASDAASIFKKSAEYAGILSNGIMTSGDSQKPHDDNEVFFHSGEGGDSANPSSGPETTNSDRKVLDLGISSINADQVLVDYNFPLRPGVVVTLRLPHEITKKDIARLSKFITSLEFDSEEGD
jgi:hypothetical protein